MNVDDPYRDLPSVTSIRVTSGDFEDGTLLRKDQASYIFGAGGRDLSPSLAWEPGPPSTLSYAITCFDPDAPTPSGFWHWAIFNVPSSVTSIPSGLFQGETRTPGALDEDLAVLMNDAGLRGYVGAAPPPGHGKHRYMFAVHALSTGELDAQQISTPAFLNFIMLDHVVARGVITGLYYTE